MIARARRVRETKVWSLRFRSYSGMTTRIDEGTYREMQERALRRLARHRNPDSDFHTEVISLTPGKEWEVCEPENCCMIPDWCGVLGIIPAESPSIDGE